MLPVVVAGEDATVCSHELYTTAPDVQYSNGPYLWTVDPVDAGVFADPTALVTTFDPNAAYEGQTVTLTLKADPIGPCTDEQSGSMYLYIEHAPWVNAGPDMTICSNESAIIEGECSYVEFTMWATTGDGYFVCPDYTCEQVEYFPGPGDLAEGCVTLILIGYPLEPCTMYVLDKMELCFDPAPIADAGPDQTICEGEIAQLDATAENYCGIQWVTLDGTGTFSDETILNPTYTPSFQDVISGTVNLTMIVAGCGACDYSIETTMALTIQRIPFITFPQYPVICEDGSIDLTGVEVENYESVLWTTMGDGTFDDAGSVTATYTPGPGDASAGAATLCLTANPIGPCLDPVQECVVIEIQQLPTINIIPDSETICYGDVYTFVEGENIEAANYSALQWAGINAAGTFDNETILTPTYTPSPLDWAQGCVQLLVVASPIGPCEVSSEDFLELCFQAPPVVDAGEDATICEDASYQLNPIIENGGTVLWETSGSGSFDDSGLATATYTPSQDDIDAGYVVLTITVGGLATCDPVTDYMTLYFQWLPIANAGGDQTVCEMLCAPPWTNGIVYLGGIVENACGSLWTTAGDGTFSDPANLNAVYTLGEADITAGSVLLTLTAIPCDPCTVSHTDDLTVTVQYFPIADAGPDQTICEGQTAQLDGDAEYETGVFWDYALLGEGDGTFDNKLIEDPVYTPGTEDIENGFVELIMVAFPISPCTYPDADIMTLYITRKPVPNAGPDATICEGETFTPQATVLYSDSVYWTCDPPDFGTFDDPELIQPTFTPVMTGNVTLILEAFDGSECAFETYVSTMNLFVNDEPQISFGFNGVEAGWNAEFGYCFGTEIGVTVFAQYGGTAPYNVTYTINGGTPITVNGLEVGDYLATPQVYEPGTYNIVVTSIEDANGCFAGPEFLSYCTATVVVWEELTLTCPDDILVGNDSGLCGASVEFEASISGEPDPITVTYMVGGTAITSPYFFPVGVTTVDVTAENICSTLTCSFTVTVEDTETPDITCVPDQTKITDPGVCSYTVVGTEFDPTVVDNCLGSIELTNDYNNLATLEGAAFEPGSTFVIWTAADPAGNIATCGFTVTVTDEENPTIACPADIIQTADQGVCYAVITALGQPVVSDNCEVFEVYNNAPVDFDFPVGITTVTWTVVDIHGNFATCDQFITVTDNELPTITCPDDITQTADAGECFATITDLGTPVTNDNCGVFEVYNDAPATFPVGLTTVTWTVVDIHGNVATCEQLVTVTDDELPTITCPDDITQTADAGECFATITDLGTPVTNDNCGVFEVYNDAPATFPVGLTTVTWTVVDIHGNQATCEQLVTVTDDELPTITCPSDILVSNDLGYCGAYIQDLGQPVVNDNCDIDSVANDAPLGAYYPVGETVVTWTVVDVNGNQATCEQTVTVTDDEAPVITLIGLDYIEICQGTPYIDEGASASDTCDGDITDQIVIVNPVDVDVPGTYTITYNVTDEAGNPAIEVTRTVVVRGLPTVDAGPDVTICKTELIFVTDGSATDYQSVEWVSAGTGFFDDPNALITNYNPSDDDKALGTVTLTLKAYGFGVCANAYAEDFMLLTFQEPPTADAGDDATICEGDTYPLAGEATYYSALLWETAGDGEFTPSADILNPTYVPGPNDIINGGVVLTFTAFDGACDDAVDEMTLNIVPVPVIEPMADIELGCDDWSEALDAWLPVNVVAVLNSAASIGTVNWTTTGAGVVTNVSVVGNMVYATYNLDENNIDKWANVVTLTLEVNGPGACGFSASASVDLLIPTQLIKIT
ncbi:MAG TPA: HYR domain-containing protein, partial [Bacteroidales bacterium]|nr:HYR domain-containing protein [Bacteroidales bacterium]